jgi:hypothetical protein
VDLLCFSAGVQCCGVGQVQAAPGPLIQGYFYHLTYHIYQNFSVKKLHLASAFCLALPVVLTTSCKKDSDSLDPAVNGAPLISASTGWEKVGAVKYSYTTVGFANLNSMQPDELQMLGSDIAVLYSENYQLSGVQGRQYFKARCTPGNSDTATTVKLSFGSGTNISGGGLFVNRLIPEKYEAVSLKYQGSPYATLSVFYEANAGSTAAGSHFIHHDNYKPHVYSNGDVLAGTLNYSSIPEIDFFDRANRGWTFFNSTTHDTAQPADFTPLRLTDGGLAGLFIYYKGSKVYLAIADGDLAATGNPLFYRSRFLMEKTELSADFTMGIAPRIVAFLQEGNTITIVVGSYDAGKDYPSMLHAYKWTEGNSSFTTLYTGTQLTEANWLKLKAKAQCTPSGTVYAWNADGVTAQLTTADASGIHTLGETGNTENIQIGAVRWGGDAFYGVAYPGSDRFDTDHNLHMDIIRLKP